MESFSLLKYWRASSSRADVASSSSSTTTIATSAATEPNNGGGGDEEEDGSFFDLEFSSSAATTDEKSESISESNDDEEEKDHNEEEEKEISFTVSSSSPSSDESISPSDDLFFKGTLLPDLETSSESDPKAIFPISLLKSATKFRVFTKKPKSDTDTDTAADSPKKSNLFIRFINADEVPIVSLFSGSRNSNKSKLPDQQVDQENKFLVHKYIDKIKPLYVRVSRKYGDKLGFSGQLTADKTDSAGGDQTARVATGFRVVMKRLGKSKSASAAVAAVTSPPPVTAKRMEEEDGIQSAIAHCKRSFNSSSAKEAQSQRSERDGGEKITPTLSIPIS